MDRLDYFKIGYIAKSHGLKGEVTMVMDQECPDLEGLASVFIEVRGQVVPHFIQSVSVKADRAFLKLEDVNSVEAANALKGCSLLLSKKERPALPKGEFYNDEVVGFFVSDSKSGDLGHIIEVFESGPNRHLIIDHQGKEVLIPVHGPFIKTISKAKKKIMVELPEGFLEL